MLVEIAASISLLAVILCSAFQAHHSLSSLMASGRDRERREEELLNRHLISEISGGISCVSSEASEAPVQYLRCVHGEETSSPSEQRFVKRSDGFSLIEVLVAATLISFLLIDSYPAFRLALRERAAHERIERLDRSIDETFREITLRAASAQLIQSGGNVRLIPADSQLASGVMSLSPARRPDPGSPLLLMVEPYFELPLRGTEFHEWMKEHRITVCGSNIPESVRYLLGVSPRAAILYEVKERSSQKPAACKQSSLQLALKPIDTTAATGPPSILFPLRRLELTYLDTQSTIRRYFFEAARTEPLLYGVEELTASEAAGEIRLSIAAREGEQTREKSLVINKRETSFELLETISF